MNCMNTEEAKAAQREYMREWRRKNKDKVRSYNMAYWQRIAERAKAERVAPKKEDNNG